MFMIFFLFLKCLRYACITLLQWIIFVSGLIKYVFSSLCDAGYLRRREMETIKCGWFQKLISHGGPARQESQPVSGRDVLWMQLLAISCCMLV